MKPKEPRIAVRVTQDLKQRLEEVQDTTGLDEPTIVRNCVDAFCQYVEQFKESPPFPLEFRKPGVRSHEASTEEPAKPKRTHVNPKGPAGTIVVPMRHPPGKG